MQSEISDSEEPPKLDLATLNERLMLALVRQQSLTDKQSGSMQSFRKRAFHERRPKKLW